MSARAFVAAVLLAASACAGASPCARDDFETHVSGASQCLLMRRFGNPKPTTLLVWLHGDVSSGGPADYHFAVARQAADEFAGSDVMSVALVRPGYPDGSGESSSVALTQSGRSDHYTTENVGEVGSAIEHLKAHFAPARVVVIGHSGGAATAALLLGMRPRLFDAALLVACPCDLVAWRSGRRPWGRSENPRAWAAKTDRGARVIALTGTADENTSPELARSYVGALQAIGVDAVFSPIEGATHNSSFRSPEVIAAVGRLIRP